MPRLVKDADQSPLLAACGSEDEVPDIGDTTAPVPKKGVLRLSPDAIRSRLCRVLTPNVNGTCKVSAEIVNQWKSKKGRQSLQQLFQTVGFDPESLAKVGIWFPVSCYCVLFSPPSLNFMPTSFG